MIRIKNTLGLARLPSEYQEVEYIKSTGTQYINTGYIPSVNAELEVQYMSESRKTYGPYIGSSGALIIPFPRTYDNKFFANYCNSATSISHNYNSSTIYTVKAYPNETTTINGTTYTTKKGTASAGSVPFYLFTYHGEPTNSAYLGNVRIYYFKMWDSGKLVIDFVPCYRKSDNAVGLYDLVEKKFYGNAGTGTFLMGSTVQTTARDLNMTPMIGNMPLIRRFVGDKLVYGTLPVKEIAFTSCPFPTSWTAPSDIYYGTYTSTNNYGEWSIVASSAASSNNTVNLAFDASDGSSWRSMGLSYNDVPANISISCPVLIKPTEITIRHSSVSNGFYSGKIQGYDPSVGSWKDLATLSQYNAARVQTFSISGDTFYSAFKVVCYRYSSGYIYPEIYYFRITKGIIKPN